MLYTVQKTALVEALRVMRPLMDKNIKPAIWDYARVLSPRAGALSATLFNGMQAVGFNLVAGGGALPECAVRASDLWLAVYRAKGEVTLSVSPGGFEVCSEAGRTILPVAPVEGLPRFPFPRYPESSQGRAELSTVNVAATFGPRGVAAAIARGKGEVRYYLQGLFVDCANNGMDKDARFVATDGHRLHTCRVETSHRDTAQSIIIPVEACDYVGAHMAQGCDMLWTDHRAEFSAVKRGQRAGYSYQIEYSLTTRPIAGTYPTWRSVLPAANAKRLRGFAQHADLVRLFDAIPQDATIAAITIRADALKCGKTIIPFKNAAGCLASGVVYANPRYLKEAIAAIGCVDQTRVAVDLGAPYAGPGYGAPFGFYARGWASPDVAVVMPMHAEKHKKHKAEKAAKATTKEPAR